MPISEGYITEPIGLKALADYFDTARDVAAVCKASGINKWSKRKPTGINPSSPAVPSSTHDKTNGYWWAVQLESLKPTNIHSHAFAYKEPTSDGFKRLAEFSGYKQAAEPNLVCEMQYDGQTLNAKLAYDIFADFPIPSAEQYGIDYIEVFRELTGSSASATKQEIFNHIYPVCVFDNYMCVMPYSKIVAVGENPCKPLCVGTEWSRFYLLDLSSLHKALASDGGITPGNHTISLGVIVNHNSIMNAPAYDGTWQEVQNTWVDEIFPVRDCVGKVFKVTVPETAPAAKLDISGIALGGVNYGVTFPTSTKDLSVHVRVTITETTSKKVATAEFYQNPKDNFGLARQIPWSDFDIQIPTEGTLYEFKGTVQTSIDDKEWTTGTGDTWSGQYTGGGTIIGG